MLITFKPNWFSFKIPSKTGSRPKGDGCTLNLSSLPKIFNKKCPLKNKNSNKSINTGNKPSNISLKKKISGTTSTPKSIKPNSKTAIDYSIKYKKVFPNTSRPKEDTFLDSISSQIRNYLKSLHKPKTQKPSKDISISALKVLDNLRWPKVLFLVWFQWKKRQLTFQKELT